MRRLLVVLCLGVGLLVWAGRGTNPAAEMATCARRLLDALGADQRGRTTSAFSDEERLNWHYIPRPRSGIPIKQLTPEQRQLADSLLRAALSKEGFATAANIRLLDQVLFEESQNPIRDPEAYFFTIFGQPAAARDWGWRMEGHHLSLNFTMRNGRVVSSTPFFFGANPAEVRRGTHTGLRTLAAEEDLGRKLVRSFEGAEHRNVFISTEAPADIITGVSRKAEPGAPAGISMSQMTKEQARLLMELIGVYAHRLRAELAESELAELRQAGMEKIHFAWAGGTEPGQPHYYRIQGPTFVIEYDNTQNHANHIHTVWRNLDRDFGLDPLRAHYVTSAHHRSAGRLGARRNEPKRTKDPMP